MKFNFSNLHQPQIKQFKQCILSKKTTNFRQNCGFHFRTWRVILLPKPINLSILNRLCFSSAGEYFDKSCFLDILLNSVIYVAR